MSGTPSIERSTAQLMACIPMVVPRDGIQQVMSPGFGELFALLGAQGITPSGPVFTHHRRRPTDTFDFSICVPVPRPVTPGGRVQNGELPAATVARVIHRGAYEGLGAAWGALYAWIAAQGRAPRADLWECYIQGPESGPDPSTWRTELNQPLLGA
jgi:effector-binding domain-containing protein